jgi:hypothetical protein
MNTPNSLLGIGVFRRLGLYILLNHMDAFPGDNGTPLESGKEK